MIETKIICTQEIIMKSIDKYFIRPTYLGPFKISVGDILIITDRTDRDDELNFRKIYKVNYINDIKVINWFLYHKYFETHFKKLTEVRNEKLNQLGI